MMEIQKKIIKDLGDGLIMRRSSPSDADALSDFNGHIHADEDFNDTVAQWTRDLLTKPHPTFHPDDFTIIEEKQSGKIVSCMCLIDQTWAYEGIEFGVGQPEIIGTHPDYRRRGLVRKQFDVVHQWSRERGQMVQAITGIPWYYRMFGYEMTLDLEAGRRGYVPQVPRLKKNEKENYTFRPAKHSDIPFISDVYSQNMQRYAITCLYNRALWQYQLDAINPDSLVFLINTIIEDLNGKPVGYIIC
jgi:predicted acetyltransferase